MYTNVNVDERFDSLNKRLKDLVSDLVDGLKPLDENALIEKDVLLAGPEAADNRFYRLTDGNVTAQLGDHPLFYYEPEELIGLENCVNASIISCPLEFAVRADIFDRDKSFKKIRKDSNRFLLLMEYFAVQNALYQLVIEASMASLHRPNFQVMTYTEGADIIREGDTDTDVYSMISGRADVIVAGRKVGEIGESEIFGEMSRLTGQSRTATVRAQTVCEVMAFAGEDFQGLARSNPTALVDIAKNLSERLASLNKQVSKQA